MNNKRNETGIRARLLVILFVCFVTYSATAQHVLDRVYEKETPRYIHPPDWNNPAFLIKEIRQPDPLLVTCLRYYARYYSKEPVHMEGCTYFFPNQQGNLFHIDTAAWIIPVKKPAVDTFLHLNGTLELMPTPVDTSTYTKKIKDDLYPLYQSYLPSFFHFYADTTLKNVLPRKPEGDPFFFMFLCTKNFSELYHPFYFKNTEVSNKEYKEFANWVRDSIARTILADAGFKKFALAGGINYSTKLDWGDTTYREALADLYNKPEERFYSRKELDSRKVIYVYTPYAYEHPDKKYLKDGKMVIGIYPDTLSWMHDFAYSYNEPMTNMYFWHPAYDGYPVVGITRLQAEAFLHWKTERMQRELDKQHKNLVIEYDLPAEYQWEMAASSQKENGGPSVLTKRYNFRDESFLCDLLLKSADTICQQVEIKSKHEHDPFQTMTRYQSAMERELHPAGFIFTLDGYFHTAPVDYDAACRQLKAYSKKKPLWWESAGPPSAPQLFALNKDENGICYMGGNVSEWMKENYKDNWLPFYTKRKALMKKVKGKDIVMALALEDYYNSLCDTNGVLVRGSNWYDERYSNRDGKNIIGMSAKTFADPTKSFSTVGFRYVVRVKRKEEDRVLKGNQ
jgi:formylglycine-generating enzyme required for sulfatase activity